MEKNDLPTVKVNKILSDQECPNVSVIIPCYLRRRFVPLMMLNIFHMD